MSLNNFHKDMLNEINSINLNNHLRNDLFNHVHNRGYRNSCNFIKKDHYTFEEVLLIIKSIDDIWENIYINNNQYSQQYIS